ncbi:T9SS type B sorting domain-containing protein [Flavobacteriaceae bacterium]|nr:T9SS type B sorting domain-containing protein [Flavobacteriaceae bacterium]
MKKLNLGNLLLLTAFLMLAFTNAFSQGPGCPNVYAGEDANVNCAGGGCVDLSASFLETGETTSYEITPIPYEPFPFIGGTAVSADTDDVWSPAIDLPFNFCFFGGTYDEIVIGSNGVISFDLNSNPPGGFCAWSFDESIPDPQLFRNTIFGVYMDVNPAPSPPTSDINYQVLGEAPCRTMVVSMPNIFYFGCNTQRLTSQMVIYETTNVIEVYVLDRPSGCSWNDGNAVIGIQNQAGNLGYTPPGRNTGDWAANTEAWRFTPNGPSNVTFEWLDASGSVIGNTPDITVCPSEEQVYTARASYLNCDGAITVVEDDVLITTSNPFTLDLGDDQQTCDASAVLLTADTDGTPGLSYEWFYNTVSQGPSTVGDDTFTVNFPNSGVYTVEVFDPADITCILSDEINITFNNQPIANTPDDLFQCDNGINTGIFDLTVNDAIVLGAQIPADFNISYHNTAADASSGASPILNPTTYLITGTVEQIFVRILDTTGTCFDTESFSINFFPITVSLGEDQETCTTNDITLTANAAGVVGLSYQWFYNAVSQGPSTIDDITFTVTAPNSGTYSVEVFNPLDATCIVTDQVEVTYLDPPVANQPLDLFQCDDGINTGIFDLTVNDAVVLGAQDPDVFDISYHNTAPDAASGVAPILNSAAYPITGAVEEIFVRIETADQTDAFLEDFGTGLGRVTHPYTNQTFNGAGGMNPNDYVVTNTSTGLNGGWHQDMEDYTVGDTNGRMIFFDVSEDINQIELYRRDFTVPANTDHIFDFSMTTVYDTDTNLCPGTGVPSRLIYQVQDAFGAVLATTTTGIVENGPNPDWNTYALNFNTGVNTTIQIVLLNDFFGACGNDLVIDDINVISLNTCSDTSSFFINFFPVSVTLGDDQETCTTDDIILTADTAGAPGLSYQWFYNTVPQGPSTVGDDTFTVSSPNSGTYSVEVFDPIDLTCVASDEIEILYNLQPIANEPDDLFQCDDGNNTGIFDLTVNDTVVLGAQDPTEFVISYHNSAADAASGAAPIATAGAYLITGVLEQIFVRIENATGTCFAIESFLLNFAPVFAGPMTDIGFCDLDGDGFLSINLPVLKDAEALGVQDPIFFDVTYHNTLDDANTDINPLPSNYTVFAPGETIFVRVESLDTSTCFAVSSFDISIVTAPGATIPTKYNICDELPNDGFGTFDLTTKDLEITGGNPDAVVSYYITFAQALAGTPAIAPADAFINTVQGFQVVYARVDNINATDCSNIVALELQVNDAPAITDPITDYFVCDLDGNGIETFDLTSKDDEILNSLVDVTLSYHESFADAEAGLFPITPATGYVSPSATIWVRAVNYEDGDISNDVLCVTIGQFDLIIGETPAFNVIPEIVACDDEIADGITEFDLNSYNDIITGGNPDVTVTYHATQEFAQAGIPALPVFYTNTTNPEDIWVRVSDVSGCYGIFMSSLVVVPRPEIFEPLPLIYCDDDNDGFGTFILTDADEQVVGGNPAGNLVVSYHVTLSDAINGVLPLVSPYDNEVPFDQIIYVRLFDIASGCYNTTILHLLVEERPAITDPQPLVVCDTDGDGIAVFNLTSAEPDMLQGLTGGPYVVSYFTDMAMTSAIVNPFSFSNSVNPQTIYVSVSDTNNDCESLTTLELRVEIPPLLVNPTPLELCDQTDILGPDDELEIFDLTSRIAEITAGDLSVSISFFESFADMQANTNAIADPTAYQNIIGGVVQNPQTIWIRAQDVNTSCVIDTGVVTLDLIVNPLPTPITPTPLEICDIDNDGFGAFTLTDKDIEIIGGEPGVIVSYHETLSDAENNIFPIGSPYQNIVANLQVVYVRATYDDVPPALGTGCWRVVELELIVNPTPIVPLDLEPIIACDPDMDGFEVFDLTQRASDIYGTQDTTQYALSYYLSEVDATAGTPAIASPNTFTNTITPLQTIWIRLEHTDSGCFKLGSFDIQVVDGPEVVQPNAFNKCDDLGEPFDGITTFDLTTQDAIITAGEPSVGVQYYETLANAQGDIDAINPATAYVNQINLQTIYVRVTDGNSLCVDTSVTLTLRVLPNPQPEQPDPIALCDTDGDGQEVFDLTIRAAQILDGETYDLLYYETELLAIDGVPGTEILDPTAYTNTSNPQDIYIRVTNPGSDALCFEIVVLTISVNTLPDDGVLLDDYEICELPFDGVSIFDLTTKIPEILVGQDMVNNVVSFYVTPGDATAGVNPIPIPEVYQNITNPQAIYVGITNTATGCYIGGVQFFNIEVKPGATATAPLLAYTLCDQEGENDGFTSFDLTLQSLLDEILNGQDPLDYLLTFHETLANAMDAENPLGASYTNIINPQIIYARVENASSGCYDVVEVILKVNQLPVITLEESYRLCVDQNGLPIASEEGAASPPVIDTGLDDALYSFEWSIDGVVQVGETGASIIATTGGVYQVTITQLSSGCLAVVSTTVTVSQAPVTWSFNLLNGAFADNHSVEILAQGLGEYVYSIDGGPFQDSNVFSNVAPGVHTIIIKDANGCGQVSFDIGVVDYPNYFTPNNDGYHDTWNIIGIADFDATANIYIFDRYGKLLKQISPLSTGWDGTYNGTALPSSDYWFRVEYTEQGIQKEIKGHFTLKR